MYGCESWTVKKVECQRINAFELWSWRRLLRVPWTAISNQSILKEISPEYSLEGLMLKLKLQYFGHLMGRTDSLDKTLMLGKIEGRRRRGWDGWMASPIQWTWVWASSRSWWWTGEAGHAAVHGVAKSQIQLSNWTEVWLCSKESACTVGGPGSIPALRRPPGEGNSYPLLCFGLENSRDMGFLGNKYSFFPSLTYNERLEFTVHFSNSDVTLT